MRFLAVGTLAALTLYAPLARAQEARHTVSGLVLDGASGEPVATAWVQVEDTRVAAVTDAEGRFVLERVPGGLRRIEVSRVGYVTRGETMLVEDDLAIRIAMVPKPIVLEGIHVTLDRLASRRNAVPYAVSVFDEQAIFRSNALDAADFVERRAGLSMIPCSDGAFACVLSRGGRARVTVVIDERAAFGGLWELVGFPVSEIDQIEVVRRCALVVVYTKPFMERVSMGKRRLYPIHPGSACSNWQEEPFLSARRRGRP